MDRAAEEGDLKPSHVIVAGYVGLPENVDGSFEGKRTAQNAREVEPLCSALVAAAALFKKRRRPLAFALGNYQSDVVVLLMGAEGLDFLDDGRDGDCWGQVLMPH